MDLGDGSPHGSRGSAPVGEFEGQSPPEAETYKLNYKLKF